MSTYRQLWSKWFARRSRFGAIIFALLLVEAIRFLRYKSRLLRMKSSKYASGVLSPKVVV